MKVFAYTSQRGYEFVTPLEAKSRNIETVFSTHAAGTRLEMYVNRRGSNHYFAFKGTESGTRETAPESLTHVLCKHVLASLAKGGLDTKLYYTYQTEAQTPILLSFTHGEVERSFVIDDEKFTVDVFCRFKQPHLESRLFSHANKWSGQLAFEIYFTHRLASNDIKVKKLARIGIPIIQIKIKEGSHLHLNEDILLADSKMAKLRIDEHIHKLENTFRKKIMGVLLRDVESRLYKEAVLLNQMLQDKETKINELESSIQTLEDELDSTNERNSELNTAYVDCLETISALQAFKNQNSPVRKSPMPIEEKAGQSMLNRISSFFKK